MAPDMVASSSFSSQNRPFGMIAGTGERDALARQAIDLPSIQISGHALANLELLASGILAPLNSFVGEADYRTTLRALRLVDGSFFPLPVILKVSDPKGIQSGQSLAFRSSKNNLLAVMDVAEVFERDFEAEAEAFASSEIADSSPFCISGALHLLELPRHLDFPELRRSPEEIRAWFKQAGFTRRVGFATQGPLYRSDEEILKSAAEDSALLIHVLESADRAGDMEQYARIRACRALVERHFERASTLLNLLPLSSDSAGGRGALLQALMLRNCGATHVVVAAEHADLARMHSAAIGVEIVTRVAPVSTPAPHDIRRDYLEAGRALPESLARPEVAAILDSAYPPRARQGFVIWFTGLPSAGKSSIADALTVMLNGSGRQLTVLDGDAVRTHLSKGLSFSRDDRDTNILRIGFVASEISKHGGAVICAAVSPYAATRKQVRSMLPEGHFIEVFVDTPASICERRDVKGFYAKARNGEIRGFTGVDDPYEPPASPEITLPTAMRTPEENALEILRYLANQGFIEALSAN